MGSGQIAFGKLGIPEVNVIWKVSVVKVVRETTFILKERKNTLKFFSLYNFPIVMRLNKLSRDR